MKFLVTFWENLVKALDADWNVGITDATKELQYLV